MPTKIRVSTLAAWRPYWGPAPLPNGARAWGTVTVAGYDAGALIETRAGVFVQGNAGGYRSLPQREIWLALRQAQAARVKSPARAAASRLNGCRGGRPRKAPAKNKAARTP